MDKNFEALNHYIDETISSNNDYIDVDCLMELINQLNLTINEKNTIIKKVYSYNLKITQNITKENKELEKISNSDEKGIADIKLKIPKQSIVSPKIEQIKNHSINVSNYVELINQFTEPSDFISLTDTINNNDLDDVINYLLAYYYSELITLKKLQYEEKNNIFNDDEKRIKYIIDNLNYLQISQQQDDLSIDNKLVYLTTKYGNTIFLNRINKISQEYYDSISNAFNSIKNGSLKNNKRIGKTSDGFYSPLFQVRDNYIRIFYLKIAPNIYLIIDAMIKKFNTTRDYSNYIRKISKVGFMQAQKFLALPTQEQQLQLEENAKITDMIDSILDIKKKVLK